MTVPGGCLCAYCQFTHRLVEAMEDGREVVMVTRCNLYTPLNDPERFSLAMDDVATVDMEQYSDTWH